MEIRRQLTIEDETLVEGKRPVKPPIKKVAAVVVMTNPFAGRYVDDLDELVVAGEELGALLAELIVKVLPADQVESFGKACIVGQDGELEHSAALIHPRFGAPVRAAIGGGKSIIASTKKIGGPGTHIDIPLAYKDAFAVNSHFDAMEVGLADAPKGDEILVALAMSNGGRPHDRIPGLKKDQVVGEDGVR